MADWSDQKATIERVVRLLSRGAALGFSLEKWKRAGLWILTQFDPGYPARLTERLGRNAPPVLFGCGRCSLLERGGLAVVGSRDTNEQDLEFSRRLGRAASQQEYPIVSGGARGVDRHAMRGALDNEGRSVGVLGSGLLRDATSALYRRPLLSGQLTLVSAVSPAERYSPGQLMVRNQYIYCLSDAAVVVASTRGKGGTWNGAAENLKGNWVPLWVKPTEEPGSGNEQIVANGGRWLPVDAVDSISTLFERHCKEPKPPLQDAVEHQAGAHPEMSPEVASIEFYDLFLARLADLTPEDPLTYAEISDRFQVNIGQIRAWIKQGRAEERIERVARPERFRAATQERQRLLDGKINHDQPVRASSIPQVTIPRELDFRDLFVAKLKSATSNGPLSSDELARKLSVAPRQVHKWLGIGVKHGTVRKTTGPVRYQASP